MRAAETVARTVARTVLVAATAAALAATLGACSKPDPNGPATVVTHDQVVKALLGDSLFASTTPAEQSCIADVLLQSEPPTDLLQFVNGEVKDLPQPADDTARSEIVTGISQCSLAVEASSPPAG